MDCIRNSNAGMPLGSDPESLESPQERTSEFPNKDLFMFGASYSVFEALGNLEKG